MVRLLFIAPLVALTLVPVYYLFLKSPPPLPDVDLKAWWGPKELKTKQDTSVKPFKVKFGLEMIKDLQERIKRKNTYTPALEDVAFEYGFNSGQINKWLKYWADEYPFSEREKFLNQFPQFKTNIQGLDIHFIRVTPKVPAGVKTVPLLLLHGWPGSVREFYETIPLLTTVSKDRDFAIEVIAPSLPGYGFSDAAVRPGLGATEVAVIFRNLMQRLGYKSYYVQGGDWGSIIGTNLATLFPNEVLGYHTNMAFSMSPQVTIISFLCSFFPSLIVEPELASRMYPLSEKYAIIMEEMGYMHIQATKPDTVGVALTDSPAGLLAYILEKFGTWTRLDNRQKTDGGLSHRWTPEKLIDNLMMYWSTKSITTSMRLYAESFNKRHLGLKMDEIPTPVPTWVIEAKYELSYLPPYLLKLKFPNLVNVTVIEDGGHFLAFELPEVFAEDVLKAVAAFRKIQKTSEKTELIPTSVPTWIIQAKYELGYQPPFLLKYKYTNLVDVTVLDDGGHFLAFELPEVFAEDVLKAVTAFRKIQKTGGKTEL